jgi:DNA-binding HxlR family transcriptional regulator
MASTASETEKSTEQTMADAGYIVSSQYREYVIEALLEGPKTPSKINDHHDEPGLAHISRALKELAKKDVVELLVPEERKKGRIYGLTDDGERAATIAASM